MAEPTDFPTHEELAPLPPRERLIRILRGITARPDEYEPVFPRLADYILEQCAQPLPPAVRAELEKIYEEAGAPAAVTALKIRRLLDETP